MLAEPTSLRQLYWLGRLTLTTSHDQHETYDRVFDQVFRGIVDIGEFRSDRRSDVAESSAPSSQDQPTATDAETSLGETSPRGTSATPGAVSADTGIEQASALAALSAQERLNDREFSSLTDDELALIQRLVEQLPLVPPLRRGRRTRRHRSTGAIDVRATLRRSHRTAGDPVRILHRKRTTKPRR